MNYSKGMLTLLLAIIFMASFIPITLGDDEFVCIPHFFNASSIEVIVGTLVDGDMASTYFIDGDWYNVSEVIGIPGLDVRFNFTGIAQQEVCGCIEVYHTFFGHPQHDVLIEVYNFTSGSWNTIGSILFNETIGWECSGLGRAGNHLVTDDGESWFRFYHEESGHPAHELKIEKILLGVLYPEEMPPDYSIIFLAIGLIFMLAIAFLYIRNK